MITYDMIKNAQDCITLHWGSDGKKVVEECAKVVPFNGNSQQFLEYCTACGGNWGGMLLTGIRSLYPEVWKAIPDDMGTFAWHCICNVLLLCGIDTSE